MLMDAFEISQLINEQQQVGQAYLEFLRVPALSVGLYSLPANGLDSQLPHTEDEVYYVVEGRGFIHVGGEDRAVEPGTVVFVAAHVEHRFHTISVDLKILVFFGPAEYSNESNANS